MSNYQLSILIPARSEMFLAKTIEDILINIEADTEVIAVLDGEWADPPIVSDSRVTIIKTGESIGQRAATNMACRLSEAKYVMKVDAHCAFDKGFDRKMLEKMQDDFTMVPIMRNLHAFDWVCPDGHRRYQGPSGPCKECGKPTSRDVVWFPKPSPQSTSYRFDKTLHFQYFGEFKKRPEGKGELTESMSLQGSCFMLTREKYWELNICDEAFGSWGQQGTEVALKTWLSGGRVIVNHNTWYAHMFRTQGGDFGFPYPQSGKQVEHARKYSRNLFLNNKWEKAVKPLSWLIDKFAPVPDWETMDLPKPTLPTKGILYYTDNQLNLKIARRVQKQLNSIGLPITSVSLKPMPHFGRNIHLPLRRSYITMFQQILAGLESMTEDIVFFCEHDVLYHPSHFDFTPSDQNLYYYNTNVWRYNSDTKVYVRTDDCRQVSGLCGYRKLLIEHYRKRLELIEKQGFSRKMGFEPGTHGREERVDDIKSEKWESEFPNIDIRHGSNLTESKWKPEDYRNKKYAQGWQEIEDAPYWGKSVI
jgi:hypothetical protein